MQSTIEHGTFTIEHDYDAPISKVYNAFADKSLKTKWFGAPDNYELDFRVGGKEINIAVPHEGTTFRYEGLYYDIVPSKRIIYTYDMYMNDKCLSVSLATIEFTEVDGKTRVTLREDGAFLDGGDTSTVREEGTRGFLDRLETILQ